MKPITRFFLQMVAIVAFGNVAKASNTECAGTLSTWASGTLTSAYNYTFSTVGTNVTITFELMQTTGGLVAQLVTPANDFTNMTLVSGQKYTYTLTNQSIGSTITYGFFCAYTGASARTTNLTYTVGNNCSGTTDNVPPVMVSAALVGTPTSSSANLLLSATDDVTNPVILFQAVDVTNGINKTLTADASGNATISGLKESTTYNLTIKAIDAANNFSDNTKAISFTTVMSPIYSGIDFETSSTGAGWVWSIFEAGTGASFAVTANPFTTGINTSATCGKLTKTANSGNDAGVQCAHGSIADLRLSTANCIVKMMVYKSTISQVGFKLVGHDGGALPAKTATNTLTNEWEELTFDFTDYINKIGNTEPYDQFAIHLDLSGGGVAGIIYIDNIKFGSKTSGIAEVQVAAFRMYPTFTSGKCAVSSDSEIGQIVVRNIMGQTVQTVSVNNNQTNLDLTSCAAGNYFVTVKLTNGKIGTQKIIKL